MSFDIGRQIKFTVNNISANKYFADIKIQQEEVLRFNRTTLRYAQNERVTDFLKFSTEIIAHFLWTEFLVDKFTSTYVLTYFARK